MRLFWWRGFLPSGDGCFNSPRPFQPSIAPSARLTPKTVETGQHPRIKLLTYSEVDEVEGKAGDFTVKVRRKAGYVDWEKCTGCGLCQQKCPSKNPSEFDRGMGMGKAIYTLSPQAVPNKPVINPSHCRYFKEKKVQGLREDLPGRGDRLRAEGSFCRGEGWRHHHGRRFRSPSDREVWRIRLWGDPGCDRWPRL